MDTDSLYQARILDHFRNPRNQRAPGPEDHPVDGFNPACGDKILLGGTREGDTVREIHYQAHGCALSVASASMLSEACAGLSAGEIKSLQVRVVAMLTSPDATEELSGDLRSLISLRRFPMRHKCALLPWRAVLDWLALAEQSDGKSPPSGS